MKYLPLVLRIKLEETRTNIRNHTQDSLNDYNTSGNIYKLLYYDMFIKLQLIFLIY